MSAASAARFAAALGRGALQRARPISPAIPPNQSMLPVVTNPVARFGVGPRITGPIDDRTAMEVAARRTDFLRRQAAAPPPSSVSLGSSSVRARTGAAPARSGPPTLREVIGRAPDAEASSYEVAAQILGLSANQLMFANALRRVGKLKFDMSDVEIESIDKLMLDIAENRFGMSSSSGMLNVARDRSISAPGNKPDMRMINSAYDGLKNSDTTDDIMNSYNFFVSQNGLESKEMRAKFLDLMEERIGRVARLEIRRVMGSGSRTLDAFDMTPEFRAILGADPLVTTSTRYGTITTGPSISRFTPDDVAELVFQNSTSNAIHGKQILESIIDPKIDDYARAIRSSYSLNELAEVGEFVKRMGSSLSPDELNQARVLYISQSNLIKSNAFSRISKWFSDDSGQEIKRILDEVKRIREIVVPNKKLRRDKQIMRSRSKGVRKATDPTSSLVGDRPTGGSSWRGGEGEVGIGQLRSDMLNTEDIAKARDIRAWAARKAREESTIDTQTITRGEGDRVGVRIINTSYADAGLSKPYVVSAKNEGIRVNLGTNAKPQVFDVKTTAPEKNVDKVWLQSLKDDLTSEYGGGTYQAITHTGQSLPKNLSPAQADEFISNLSNSELQSFRIKEMQHWVDRYGYRLMKEIRYARTRSELSTLASRLNAAEANGLSPKGFANAIRQVMRDRSSLISSAGSSGRTRGNIRARKWRPPDKLLISREDMDRFFGVGKTPAGYAARERGVTGIQFPQ